MLFNVIQSPHGDFQQRKTNLHKFTVLYAIRCYQQQSQVGIWNIYDAIYKVKCIKTEATAIKHEFQDTENAMLTWEHADDRQD